MIIKGTSRGNPKQLAAHLQRADTNERVSILELNSPTDDLAGTFREWQALTAATGGTKGLYHANISPDAGYTMTPEQWERAADVLAEKLGLAAGLIAAPTINPCRSGADTLPVARFTTSTAL